MKHVAYIKRRSTRVDRVGCAWIRVDTRVEARIFGRVRCQNDTVLTSLYKALFFFFLNFFLLFFWFSDLERETPVSLYFEAISGDVAPPGTAAVATDRRRFRLASGEENGTRRQIGTLWFRICASFCLKVIQKQRIWIFHIRKKSFFFSFLLLFFVAGAVGFPLPANCVDSLFVGFVGFFGFWECVESPREWEFSFLSGFRVLFFGIKIGRVWVCMWECRPPGVWKLFFRGVLKGLSR